MFKNKKSIIILTLQFFVLYGCRKEETFPHVEVVGHAATGLHMERLPFPGNTQEAINFAAALGLKHIEVDLQLTADGHWVLFHGDFLTDKTNFSGCVSQYTADEIKNIRYHGFPNVKIPFLHETDFSAFNYVFFDIKHFNACNNYSLLDTALMHKEILHMVEKFPEQKFVVVCRHEPVLTHFRNLGLEVCHEVFNYQSLKNSIALNNFDFFAIRNAQITREQVAESKNLGLRIKIFGVRSKAGNRDAMRKSPNFVMSDAVVSALHLTK
jgi:glycerophosphoryl diester phosphodiesterase